MSIFKACMNWRHYLHGAKCTVYTDHEPLKYIYVLPHLNAHQVCWLQQLAELDLLMGRVCVVDHPQDAGVLGRS